MFFGPFGVAVASLGGRGGGGRGGWSWCFSCVCSICACLGLSVSSSFWGLGRAAVCDCGTPWTFLLPFFHEISLITRKKQICKKRSTISSHRNTNSLPIKFSSKSNKNIIQKINKSITDFLTRP